MIRLLGPNVRPAEVSSLADLVKDVVTAGTASRIVFARVGADVTDVEPVGDGVDGKSPGVSESHGIDFRAGFLHAFGKEIALRDFIGAVWLYFNAKDFSAEVVGVSRGFLGIKWFAAFSFVDWRKSIRGEGAGVVSG